MSGRIEISTRKVNETARRQNFDLNYESRNSSSALKFFDL